VFGILFNIDEDEEDDDEEGDTMNMNSSSGVMDKNSGTKRDDSRRRAAHTAAEQKRRNAIRVFSIEKQILFFLFILFLRKDTMLYKVLFLIVIYLIQSVHKKLVKRQFLNDVRQRILFSSLKYVFPLSYGLSFSIE
jgi:hypothetical protein